MAESREENRSKCIMALALVIGSSVTAFASSAQVVEQQNDMYRETRVQEADISDAD